MPYLLRNARVSVDRIAAISALALAPAITERTDYCWPEGKRLAVCVALMWNSIGSVKASLKSWTPRAASPFCDARQPGAPAAPKADSMGKSGSSEVTSRSRSARDPSGAGRVTDQQQFGPN